MERWITLKNGQPVKVKDKPNPKPTPAQVDNILLMVMLNTYATARGLDPGDAAIEINSIIKTQGKEFALDQLMETIINWQHEQILKGGTI